MNFIFRYHGQAYSIGGLAHLSTNKGALYRLDRSADDQFTFTKILQFDDAPEVLKIVGDVIYIVSHGGLFIIEDLKSKKVFSDVFWTSLYPNSMVVLDPKNIFIGMRGGYAKVNIPEERIQFFK